MPFQLPSAPQFDVPAIQQLGGWLRGFVNGINQFITESTQALQSLQGVGTTAYKTLSISTGSRPLHLVGAAGEPGFQNGWVNYDSYWAPAGYWMDASSRIHLQGLVRAGTVSPSGVIFTLPAGYRPTNNILLPAISHDGANTVVSRVTVMTTGAVIAEVGGNVWFGLNGVSFDAAPPVAADRYACFPIQIQNPLDRMPVDVHVAKVMGPETDVLGGSLAVSWSMTATGEIVINNIPGLNPSCLYEVVLAIS